MRYLLIILLLCSCSTKFLVNGHEIKQRKKVTLINDHTPILIAAFLLSYSVTPMIIHK